MLISGDVVGELGKEGHRPWRAKVAARTHRILIGSILAYCIACCLPCYEVAFWDSSNVINGWTCLIGYFPWGFGHWFPNPILFIAWILVWRRRASAKYWAVVALISAICGIDSRFVWKGAGLWIASMVITVAAGFLLVPDTRPLLSWKGVRRLKGTAVKGQ